MAVHGPVTNIEVVDVLLDDMVAGHASEVKPVANLIFQVAHAFLSSDHPKSTLVPVAVHLGDVADGTFFHHLKTLHVGKVVASLGTGNDGEILFFSFLCRLNHLADTRAIDTDRLFGKDVLARFYGSLDVSGSESRRGCEDNDIDAASENLLIGIQTAIGSVSNVYSLW
jgi:hypothetical protein